MQILLANAKIMVATTQRQPRTQPLFQEQANELACDMAQLDVAELARQLDCSNKLAVENLKRYQAFHHAEKLPALFAYNGQAYKHLKANTLSEQALTYAQQHLWITCFLYGLLRPMDGIVPYRMEHCTRLPATNGQPVNQFWKNKLTDILLQSVKDDDHTLLHLSTEEYEHLFDWKRVCQEVNVIQPLFYVQQPNGTLKMQAVWAKSCRGAMVRYILQNQITTTNELKHFSYEGFEWQAHLGEEAYPHSVRRHNAAKS